MIPAVPVPCPIVVAAVPVLFIFTVPVRVVAPRTVFVEPELPIPSVVELVVPRLTVPAPLVFSVSVPVPFALKVMPVLLVLGLIVGLAPANVKVVELNVLLL